MRGQPRVGGCLFLKGMLGLKKVLQRLFQSFTLSSGCAWGQGWGGNGSLIHNSHVEEVLDYIRIFWKYLELQALGHGRQPNDAFFTLNLRHYLGDIRGCVMFWVPGLRGRGALPIWGIGVPSYILGANLDPHIRPQDLRYGLRWDPLGRPMHYPELVPPWGNFGCFYESEIKWGDNGSIHF